MAISEVYQAAISGGVGILGVGIGVGVFKATIKQIIEDIREIKRKQSVLRGGEAGDLPIYMTRLTCGDFRQACFKTIADKLEDVDESITEHHECIKGLNNFARWFMQKEGATMKEINETLNGH